MADAHLVHWYPPRRLLPPLPLTPIAWALGGLAVAALLWLSWCWGVDQRQLYDATLPQHPRPAFGCPCLRGPV